MRELRPLCTDPVLEAQHTDWHTNRAGKNGVFQELSPHFVPCLDRSLITSNQAWVLMRGEEDRGDMCFGVNGMGRALLGEDDGGNICCDEYDPSKHLAVIAQALSLHPGS